MQFYELAANLAHLTQCDYLVNVLKQKQNRTALFGEIILNVDTKLLQSLITTLAKIIRANFSPCNIA